MELNLVDPSEIPLPPDQVRIVGVAATPYPDGQRVKLNIELTAFQARPNLEIRATNPMGEPVAEVSIIEAMTNRLELTFHLRGPRSPGEHHLNLRLLYASEDDGEELVDETIITFEVNHV